MRLQPKKTKIPKKQKDFNFDNILSLNSDLDLSNKEEMDKWFKLISSHTGMIYYPADENEYAKLTQKFSNSCVNFWFNDDSKEFHFKVELDGKSQFLLSKKLNSTLLLLVDFPRF